MPIYEYCCNDCEQIFEEWQRNHDELDVPCPVCGGQSRRVISNTSFVLKGTGWYVTDYAGGKSGNGGAATGAEDAGGSDAKPEAASAGSGDAGDSGGTPPKKAESSAPKADTSSAQS